MQSDSIKAYVKVQKKVNNGSKKGNCESIRQLRRKDKIRGVENEEQF